MDVARVGTVAVLMLTPTLVVGAALQVPRGVRAVQRRFRKRVLVATPEPVSPPIERLAADLRRLLVRHEALRRSTEVAVRARRLRALEAAITDCASEAAVALGVPCPDPVERDALSTAQLRRLLGSLADAGLVLLPGNSLLAPDRRP